MRGFRGRRGNKILFRHDILGDLGRSGRRGFKKIGINNNLVRHGNLARIKDRGSKNGRSKNGRSKNGRGGNERRLVNQRRSGGCIICDGSRGLKRSENHLRRDKLNGLVCLWRCRVSWPISERLGIGSGWLNVGRGGS